MYAKLFKSWTDAELANIGLARTDDGIKIDIPQDANIYHMTVGAQIKAGRSAAPAMIFEHGDGTI